MSCDCRCKNSMLTAETNNDEFSGSNVGSNTQFYMSPFSYTSGPCFIPPTGNSAHVLRTTPFQSEYFSSGDYDYPTILFYVCCLILLLCVMI